MTVSHRLHILHLGRFHRPDQPGGTERHVATLLTALAPFVDADNLVAAEGLHGDSFPINGYRVLRAPCFGLFRGVAIAPAIVAWARRLHAERPYDVVHVHFPDPLSQLVAQALPRQVKRVVTWHSDIVRQRLLLKVYRPLMNTFLGDVDAVVAATQAHFDSSTQLDSVPHERRSVIPFGLDYSLFEAPGVTARAATLRRSVAPDAPLIFAVGRHVYYKGFEFLIRAMAQLPKARLVLGGHGPLTETLKTIAKGAGVQDRVTFTGHLDEADLAAWFHACDVFCLPSTAPAEAFGLVQLEAMACSKPVVCTLLGNGVNAVNLDEVTGLTASPGDVVSLANCLRRLIDDGELRWRLGSAGKQRTQEVFSTRHMAQATLALYRRLTSP